MTLKDTILDVQQGIRSGRFVNEALVSQGVVLRLLHELSWPTYDTEVVAPEYTLEGKRVDFALCHPRSRPKVFVEVKRLGHSEGADAQLFQYTFLAGVPMAVLTDGQEWHFFLPGEEGRFQERRVYKLDLIERDIEESAERLERYLSYEAICSGKAIELARRDYQNVAKNREISKALPTAFARLITEQDEMLIELIADRVEDLCGYRPDPDTVVNFLVKDVPTTTIRPTVETLGTRINRQRAVTPQTTGPCGFILLGEEYSAQNPTEAYFQVFEEISRRDETFLSRFAALPKHGKRRRYVAWTKEELYPGRPDLAEAHSHQLAPVGGLVPTIAHRLKRESYRWLVKSQACGWAAILF